MSEVIQKRFESPDESRRFEKGRLDIVRIGGVTLGRAHYEPGWKWSEHVGPTLGARRCSVEHRGRAVPGSWATSRTRRCTSWARSSTRRSERGRQRPLPNTQPTPAAPWKPL